MRTLVSDEERKRVGNALARQRFPSSPAKRAVNALACLSIGGFGRGANRQPRSTARLVGERLATRSWRRRAKVGAPKDDVLIDKDSPNEVMHLLEEDELNEEVCLLEEIGRDEEMHFLEEARPDVEVRLLKDVGRDEELPILEEVGQDDKTKGRQESR